MPGVFGIVSRRERARALTQQFGAVCRAMSRGGRLVGETATDPEGRWALGRVHLGVLQPAPQLSGNGSVKVLFHGDLHNEAELRSKAGDDGAAAGVAPLLAALYARRGRAMARDLQGAFCAAVLDEAAGELLLISDRLGSYPLYWFTTEGGFVFASELRAALRAHPKPAIDPRAVADLLKFGFPMGDKTLAAGVEMIPAASTLLYRAATNDVTIDAYASIAELFQQTDLPRQEYHAAVEAAFNESMERALRGSHRFGLSLSGGLDTRVILSAADKMGRSEGMRTFTLGGRGCADEVIGYELARLGRTNHRFVALDDHYLSDLVPTVDRMVSLTDGMYVSHGFTEMLALKGFEDSDCSVLLRGHAGELAKAGTAWPFHTDTRMYSLATTDEFVSYLMARLTHVSRDDAARSLLADEYSELAGPERARRSLEESVAGVPLSPPDLCSYVYLKEYHRRVTIPSLEIFRNVTEVRMPLADVGFLRAVLQGPARWRDDTKLHQGIIAANGPAYLRVRNPNTGAPAGAGPVTEAVLDKVNSLFRRLNVYGYRHYHSFDGWMRKALLETVDRIVLAPDTLARGLFRESAVRDRVAQAHQGVTDHDDVLQVLVTAELWQRQVL